MIRPQVVTIRPNRVCKYMTFFCFFFLFPYSTSRTPPAKSSTPGALDKLFGSTPRGYLQGNSYSESQKTMDNHDIIQDVRGSFKSGASYHFCLLFSFLAPDWHFPWNKITFCRSWFSEFYSPVKESK